MIPPSMMAPSAASIKRSTVHHHAENGVRSARETIGGLLPGFEFPVLPKYGCQLVKKEFPISILLRRLSPAGNDDARQLAHEIEKGVAAHIEIIELVVGVAGGRK